MRILALLPVASVERVSLALGKGVLVETVSQQRQFLELAQSGIWRSLIIDPDLVGREDASEFIDGVSRCSAPLIVYTSLTRASARTIAILARRSLAAVVLRGFDDSPARLRSTLDAAPFESLGCLLVESLSAELDTLPREVRRATIAAFCASAPVTSPKALAVLSGQSRRSVDRWFRRVGLKPAKWVLAASLLIRAYSFLEDESLSLASVALKSGFGSAKALSHNSVALTGAHTRVLRATYPPDALIARLCTELRPTTVLSKNGLPMSKNGRCLMAVLG